MANPEVVRVIFLIVLPKRRKGAVVGKKNQHGDVDQNKHRNYPSILNQLVKPK